MKKILWIFLILATIPLCGQTNIDIIASVGEPDRITVEDDGYKYIYEKYIAECLFITSYKFNRKDEMESFDIMIIDNKHSMRILKEVAKDVLRKYGFKYLRRIEEADYYLKDNYIAILRELKYLDYNTIIIKTIKGK